MLQVLHKQNIKFREMHGMTLDEEEAKKSLGKALRSWKLEPNGILVSTILSTLMKSFISNKGFLVPEALSSEGFSLTM